MNEGQISGSTAERKLVSALFCDLVGSTSLGERLDPERLRSVQHAYFDRMRSVVERFGGTVEKFAGDAVLAVFGVPISHEDDALRAVLCGLAMREAIKGLNDTLGPAFDVELTVRIGLSTGEAVTGGPEEALATGDVMATAARLEQAAEPSEILVGRETMFLTRDRVEYAEPRRVQAKGKTEPIEASGALRERIGTVRSRAPFVGRRAELETLAATIERAVEGGPRVAVILGEPGIGKSRLADELAARATGRASVYRGACLSYGQGSAWLPIADVVKAEVGIVDADSPETATSKLVERLQRRHDSTEASIISSQLGALIGARQSASTTSSELLWAFRRYLDALGRERPVLIVWDDLHWATPSLLELLVELVGSTASGAPVAYLLLGRPELKTDVAELLGSERTTLLVLDGLSPIEVRLLTEGLTFQEGAVLGEVEERVAARAGGNPLFIEEIVAASLEDGSAAEVPRSLRALIAARLDALGAASKSATRAAAILGDVFWDDAITAVRDAGVGDDVRAALHALRTRGLIDEESSSAFVGSRQFRFHHPLVREVAYESVPKADRSALHRRAAFWLEARAPTQPELWIQVAHHFDRALELHLDVAPLDRPDPALVDAAIRSHLEAGERSRLHGAVHEAVTLLRRGADLDPASPAGMIVRGRLAVALAAGGQVEEAVTAADAVLASSTVPEAISFASLALAHAAYVRGDTAAMKVNASKAIEGCSLEAPGVEAQAYDILAWMQFWTEDTDEADATWAHVARIALKQGDTTLAASATAWRSLSACFKLDVVAADALAAESAGIADASGSLRGLAISHMAFSRVRELQNRLSAAVEHGREYLRLSIDGGEPLNAIAAAIFGLSDPLLRLERLDEAWEILADALARSDAMGGSAFGVEIRIQRARILAARGRGREAEAELRLALPERWDEDGRYVPGGRADLHLFPSEVRAMGAALLAQNHIAEAEELWRKAVDVSSPHKTDRWPITDDRLWVGRYLAERGRLEEAATVVAPVRAWIKGSGAALYEGQLRQLDRILGEDSQGPPGR